MNYKGFRIEKEPAYVWRLTCFRQFADFSWIACWYVYDAEGKRVAGGYDSGSNVRSGQANIPRRKDAKAWVDGYLAFRNEPGNRKEIRDGYFVYAPYFTARDTTRDEEERAHFEGGYWRAQKRIKATA